MKKQDVTIEKVKVKEIKFFEFNRAIKMSQVDKLANSISKYGQLRMPILVRTKINSHRQALYCVDGQHMITALFKLNKHTTDAIVLESDDKKTIVEIMATLNNVVCRWTIDNYVDAYSSLGLSDYNTLKSHKLATGFTYNVSALILGEAKGSEIIKGLFKSSAKDSDNLTQCLIEVCSILNTSNSKFMKAFIGFYRSKSIKYNHAAFISLLAKSSTNMCIVHDETAMKRQLFEIYKPKAIAA